MTLPGAVCHQLDLSPPGQKTKQELGERRVVRHPGMSAAGESCSTLRHLVRDLNHYSALHYCKNDTHGWKTAQSFVCRFFLQDQPPVRAGWVKRHDTRVCFQSSGLTNARLVM